MPSNTIETGDIILVTGITGYVGSHVADQLLAAGFKVRGAVRNKQRAQWLKDVFDEKYEPGKLSLVSVVDMHLAGALSHAIEGKRVTGNLGCCPLTRQVSLVLFMPQQ